METSRVEEYLKGLLEENKDDIPTPSNRVDYYLNYLVKGGKLEDLPTPEARMDEYLYELCKKGISGGTSGGNTGLDGKEVKITDHHINWQPVLKLKLNSIDTEQLNTLKNIEITSIVGKEVK